MGVLIPTRQQTPCSARATFPLSRLESRPKPQDNRTQVESFLKAFPCDLCLRRHTSVNDRRLSKLSRRTQQKTHLWFDCDRRTSPHRKRQTDKARSRSSSLQREYHRVTNLLPSISVRYALAILQGGQTTAPRRKFPYPRASSHSRKARHRINTTSGRTYHLLISVETRRVAIIFIRVAGQATNLRGSSSQLVYGLVSHSSHALAQPVSLLQRLRQQEQQRNLLASVRDYPIRFR